MLRWCMRAVASASVEVCGWHRVKRGAAAHLAGSRRALSEDLQGVASGTPAENVLFLRASLNFSGHRGSEERVEVSRCTSFVTATCDPPTGPDRAVEEDKKPLLGASRSSWTSFVKSGWPALPLRASRRRLPRFPSARLDVLLRDQTQSLSRS